MVPKGGHEEVQKPQPLSLPIAPGTPRVPERSLRVPSSLRALVFRLTAHQSRIPICISAASWRTRRVTTRAAPIGYLTQRHPLYPKKTFVVEDPERFDLVRRVFELTDTTWLLAPVADGEHDAGASGGDRQRRSVAKMTMTATPSTIR